MIFLTAYGAISYCAISGKICSVGKWNTAKENE